MLYRLSYSLGDNPTGGPGPGNTPAEHVGMNMKWSHPWMLLVGLTAAGGGTSAWPQAVATSAEKAVARPKIVTPADDGSILLHGSVATIRGTTLRWEPEEKKRTLGFWTQVEDAAEWTFVTLASGTFEVEVLQGCGTGQGGSQMLVTLDPDGGDPTTIPFVVADTGGFQEFRLRTIGRLTIATAGEHVLRVKPETIAKKAACDIRQIRLVPVTSR